jgi:hypothetical protein
MHIQDSNHVIVIGAEKFSCEWTNLKVAINYREKSDGDGEVVSVELQ